ncbi:MAG TPA: hypothetical protein VEI97_17340, partial [bacterium]|nr:hypothetical protein [bacterium]
MEHQYERGESPWELLQQLTETDELLELYGIVYGHEELLDDDVLADLHAQVAQAPERRRGRLGERLAMLEAILEQGIYQYFLGAFGDENPAKARRLMGLLTTEEPTQKAAMVQASPDLMDDET